MILCCGEALIDMVPESGKNGVDALLPVPGGAVFNTAIGLGRLGVETAFFCPLSTDLFGDQLASALAAAHVDTGLCPRVDRPTTLAFVQLQDGQAKYVFYDENTALRSLDESELPDIAPTVSAGFFGGISLISEPCGSAYEALMQRMHANALVMMDPNIRPGFITDEKAYRARIDRMMAQSDIVKLSDEDFDWLFPDQKLSDVADAMMNAGTQILLITRGGDNPLAFTRDGQFEVPAIQVEVADTIGAGDTFNAGFLAALHKMGLDNRAALKTLDHKALEKALTLAAATAAVTVSRTGANPPWAKDVAQYLPG